MVALQVEDAVRFADLAAALDGWSGIKANSAYADANLAFLYRSGGALQVGSVHEILTGEEALPGAPYVLEGTFNGTPVVVINNHYKCCGDGEIDLLDDWDEEARWQEASLLLVDYIAENFAEERVILVGDLNDELTDPAADNVFGVFLDDPDHWRCVDLVIAQDD